MANKIFAHYNENNIRVYQAFNDTIADEAIKLGTFGPSFKMDRMTWIKPSFLWMMYRSGWGTKEGQNRVLAIDMKRTGFDYIVKNAVLSSYSEEVYGAHTSWRDALKKSEIRCQWDPERDIYGAPQSQRTIQLGIKGHILEKYVCDWVVQISDITSNVRKIHDAIHAGNFETRMLPLEQEYRAE